MSNLTDFFPSGGGGGGLTPKFQEFNASGTFTPTQALIDAGGYIEVFLVAGGSTGTYSAGDTTGGSGGEVLIKKMYLTFISGCNVTIGAGGIAGIASGSVASNAGGDSIFLGSSSGGVDLTAKGSGVKASPSWGGASLGSNTQPRGITASTGVLGYGAGGASNSGGGYYNPPPNNGAGAYYYAYPASSGYCLIKWYE